MTKAKIGIVEPVEVVVARQWKDIHVSASSCTDATIRDTVFSVRPFLAKTLYTRFHSTDSTCNNTGVFGRSVSCVSVLRLYTKT